MVLCALLRPCLTLPLRWQETNSSNRAAVSSCLPAASKADITYRREQGRRKEMREEGGYEGEKGRERGSVRG